MSKMEEEFRGRVPADRPVFFEPTELKRCHSRFPGEILTDEEERFEAASIKERANTVWSWTHLKRREEGMLLGSQSFAIGSMVGSITHGIQSIAINNKL